MRLAPYAPQNRPTKAGKIDGLDLGSGWFFGDHGSSCVICTD